MKNRISTLQQVEALIQPLTLAHVPQDSDVEAVINQWLHAIAS
ncbi:hypothetical protein [Marinospirillum minutulum]|nr:hypothetical protein [Marinospirillum minutulum]